MDFQLKEQMALISSVLERMQNTLKCSICLDLLNCPVTTKCGHSFCGSCIDQILERSRSSHCPLCMTTLVRRSLSSNKKIVTLVNGVRDIISSVKQDLGYNEPQGKKKLNATPVSKPILKEVAVVEEENIIRRGTRKREQVNHYSSDLKLKKAKSKQDICEAEVSMINKNELKRDKKVLTKITNKKLTALEDTKKPSILEIDKQSILEIYKPSDLEIDKPSVLEIDKPSVLEIDKPSDLEIDKPSVLEIDKPSDLEIDKPSDLEIDKPSDLEIDKSPIKNLVQANEYIDNQYETQDNIIESNSVNKVKNWLSNSVKFDQNHKDETSFSLEPTQSFGCEKEILYAERLLSKLPNSAKEFRDISPSQTPTVLFDPDHLVCDTEDKQNNFVSVNKSSYAEKDLKSLKKRENVAASSKSSRRGCKRILAEKNISDNICKKSNTVDNASTDCKENYPITECGVPVNPDISKEIQISPKKYQPILKKYTTESSKDDQPHPNSKGYNIRFASCNKLLDKVKPSKLTVGKKTRKSPGWSHIEGVKRDLRSKYTSLEIKGGEGKLAQHNVSKLDNSNLPESSQESVIVIEDPSQLVTDKFNDVLTFKNKTIKTQLNNESENAKNKSLNIKKKTHLKAKNKKADTLSKNCSTSVLLDAINQSMANSVENIEGKLSNCKPNFDEYDKEKLVNFDENDKEKSPNSRTILNKNDKEKSSANKGNLEENDKINSFNIKSKSNDDNVSNKDLSKNVEKFSEQLVLDKNIETTYSDKCKLLDINTNSQTTDSSKSCIPGTRYETQTSPVNFQINGKKCNEGKLIIGREKGIKVTRKKVTNLKRGSDQSSQDEFEHEESFTNRNKKKNLRRGNTSMKNDSSKLNMSLKSSNNMFEEKDTNEELDQDGINTNKQNSGNKKTKIMKKNYAKSNLSLRSASNLSKGINVENSYTQNNETNIDEHKTNAHTKINDNKINISTNYSRNLFEEKQDLEGKFSSTSKKNISTTSCINIFEEKQDLEGEFSSTSKKNISTTCGRNILEEKTDIEGEFSSTRKKNISTTYSRNIFQEKTDIEGEFISTSKKNISTTSGRNIFQEKTDLEGEFSSTSKKNISTTSGRNIFQEKTDLGEFSSTSNKNISNTSGRNIFEEKPDLEGEFSSTSKKNISSISGRNIFEEKTDLDGEFSSSRKKNISTTSRNIFKEKTDLGEFSSTRKKNISTTSGRNILDKKTDLEGEFISNKLTSSTIVPFQIKGKLRKRNESNMCQHTLPCDLFKKLMKCAMYMTENYIDNGNCYDKKENFKEWEDIPSTSQNTSINKLINKVPTQLDEISSKNSITSVNELMSSMTKRSNITSPTENSSRSIKNSKVNIQNSDKSISSQLRLTNGLVNTSNIDSEINSNVDSDSRVPETFEETFQDAALELPDKVTGVITRRICFSPALVDDIGLSQVTLPNDDDLPLSQERLYCDNDKLQDGELNKKILNSVELNKEKSQEQVDVQLPLSQDSLMNTCSDSILAAVEEPIVHKYVKKNLDSKCSVKKFKRIKLMESSEDESEEEIGKSRKKKRIANVYSQSPSNSAKNLVSSEELRDFERYDQNIWDYYQSKNLDSSLLTSKLNKDNIQTKYIKQTENLLNESFDALMEDQEYIPGTEEVLKYAKADLDLATYSDDSVQSCPDTINLMSQESVAKSTKALFKKCDRSLDKAKKITQNLRKKKNATENSLNASMNKTNNSENSTQQSFCSQKSRQSIIFTSQRKNTLEREMSEKTTRKQVEKSVENEFNAANNDTLSLLDKGELDHLEKNINNLAKTNLNNITTKNNFKNISANNNLSNKVNLISNENLCPVDSDQESEELFRTVPSDTQDINRKNTTQKPISLICTGLTEREITKVHELISNVCEEGTKMNTSWSDQVTHVVAKTDSSGITDRTLKYLYGVANGVWIVSFSWVTDSLNSSTLLPEEDYEVLDCTSSPGPKRGRNRSVPLFGNCQFSLVPPFTNITENQLKELINSCGGKVVEGIHDFEESEKGLKLIAIDSDFQADQKDTRKMARSGKVLLAHDWILECIGMCILVAIRPYILGEPSELQLKNSGITGALLTETQDFF